MARWSAMRRQRPGCAARVLIGPEAEVALSRLRVPAVRRGTNVDGSVCVCPCVHVCVCVEEWCAAQDRVADSALTWNPAGGQDSPAPHCYGVASSGVVHMVCQMRSEAVDINITTTVKRSRHHRNDALPH